MFPVCANDEISEHLFVENKTEYD